MHRHAPALLACLTLVACAGEEAGHDLPDEGSGGTGGAGFVPPAVLPAGVFEFSLELEWPEDPSPFWSAPLPQTIAGRMNAIDPWPEFGVQEVNFFPLEGDWSWDPYPWSQVHPTQLWIPQREDAFTGFFEDVLEFQDLPAGGHCRDVVTVRASEYRFWPVDGDGDGFEEGIEGTVAGTATQQIPWTGEGEPTRPFRGRLRATPDRTPPAIVLAPEPIGPWGDWRIRFTEPVLFDEVRPTFVLETGEVSIPMQSNNYTLPVDSSDEQACNWDWPLSSLPLFPTSYAGPPGPSFPAGATVRFANLRIRDLAGNVLEGDHLDTGLRVADPRGRPADSFEDGRLDGWITSGDVRLVSADVAPEGADGAWLVSGSVRDGFSMTARIDVPDTEAPALEFIERLDAVSGWLDRDLEVEVGTPDVATFGWARLPSSWSTVRVDLTALRGTTSLVSLGVGPGECSEGQVRVLIDGFRVVP